MEVPRYQQVNRLGWDQESDAYQERNAALLARPPDAWGVWRIPEDTLHALGDVSGKDVLELGCGAAQWSIHLAGAGARIVGLDLSARQLQHARRLMKESAVRVPLVQASAAATPFRAASFDIVFCDHGAMSFADPKDTVPEAARLLRPGGLLVFCVSSPIWLMTLDPVADTTTQTLHSDYFGMRSFEWPGSIDFQIPYGEWLRLFRDNGLAVEDLIELRAPEDAVSTYRDESERQWARRWPKEDLWRLRKKAG